jgi:hypothetical protein
MSKKVAKLVYVSMVTRVIVDENASETDILIQAQSKFIEKIENEIHENLEEIVDDIECPYEGEYLDIYGSISDKEWKDNKELIMGYSVDGTNYNDNEHRMTHTDDWSVDIRIHKEDLPKIKNLLDYLDYNEVV